MCATDPTNNLTAWLTTWASLLILTLFGSLQSPIVCAGMMQSRLAGVGLRQRHKGFSSGLELMSDQLGQPDLSGEELCRNFSGVGTVTHSRLISTPFYPNFYAANVECIRVVTAPTLQHLISLDFRNFQFEVEADAHGDCTYDYVEIRNGPYGFSPLIGRFCGEKSPGVVTADSGVMWIYFRTDATLQYSGFQAVLNYVLMPTLNPRIPRLSDSRADCKFNLTQGEDGTITSHYLREVALRIGNETNRTEIECVWRVEAAPHYQLRFLFRTYELAYPNECSMNYMEIYRGNTASGHKIRRFCGLTANKVDVDSNVAFIRIYVTLKSVWKTNFDIFYTVFVSLKNCSTEENFYCGDDTCIPRSLVCNQRSNCITEKDEQNCTPKETKIQFSTGPYLIFLVIIICLIIGIVTCAAVINLSPRFRKKPPVQQAARSFEESVQPSPALNHHHLNSNFTLNSPPTQLPSTAVANGQLPPGGVEMVDFSTHNGGAQKSVKQRGCGSTDSAELLQIHRSSYSPPPPPMANGLKGPRRLPQLQLDMDDTASTTVSAPNGRIRTDPHRHLYPRKALSTQLETVPMVDTQPIQLSRMGRRPANHRRFQQNSGGRRWQPPLVHNSTLSCQSEDPMRNLSLEQLNRLNSTESLTEAEFFVVAI